MISILDAIRQMSTEFNLNVNTLVSTFTSGSSLNLNDLYTTDLNKEYTEMLNHTVHSIRNNIPIARLTNHKWFYNSLFYISPFVFDPRSDTENIVELAISYAPKTILDIGTGSGAILISILKNLQYSTGVGYDISPKVINVAQYNAQRILDNARYKFTTDFNQISQKFDVIISNPPYIKKKPDVTATFDPNISLYYQNKIYEQILEYGHQYLNKNSHLILEIPEYLCQSFCERARKQHFSVDQVVSYLDVNFISMSFSGY